jgi:hypothetical protein
MEDMHLLLLCSGTVKRKEGSKEDSNIYILLCFILVASLKFITIELA